MEIMTTTCDQNSSRKAGGDLSTVASETAAETSADESGGDLSTVADKNPADRLADKAGGDLSTVASFQAINSRRERAGISVEALIAEARISRHTWKHARKNNGAGSRRDTLLRLDTAIDALIRSTASAGPPAAIAGLIRAIEIILHAAIGWDRELMAACDPARDRVRLPQGVPPARLRLMAVYLAAVDLQIPNADLARALGIERQAVKQGRDKVHDLRDDERVDALLDRCARLLIGRAE